MTENGNSLELFADGALVFSSRGRWLHPLFELEVYLCEHPLPAERLALSDKIVGKAAALLIVRMGIKTVHAGILSDPAYETLVSRGAAVTWETRVCRIACATEELLLHETDPEKAWRLLRDRINANGGTASRSRSAG
jgi:hypothetical protein